MSKFFRSGSSTSSSEGDSSSERDDTTQDITEQLSRLAASSAENEDSSIALSSATGTSNHTDILLHALLEERCLEKVLSLRNDPRSTRGPRLDSLEAQAEANERYQRLCARLAPNGLISKGLETAEHAATRHKYRVGLDMLDDQCSMLATVGHNSKLLLTDTDPELPSQAQRSSPESGVNGGRELPPNFPPPVPKLLQSANNLEGRGSASSSESLGRVLGLGSQHATGSLLHPRYRSEFEELNTLGRGGYGVVYQARHRLDKQTYAVKKVPLSASRLQQIQRKGPSELDEVLKELRTLARLDHPNIVRYFNGWVEWSDTRSASGGDHSGEDRESVSRDDVCAVLGANASQSSSLDRVFTESDASEADIVFEHSSSATQASVSSRGHIDDTNPELCKSIDRSTTASTSDGTESVGKYLEPPAVVYSSGAGEHFVGAALVLHIQMSLHPMTLADFLAPPTQIGSAPPPLAHCFHLQPFIAILKAVLDGLEYLHAQNVVHRDIKPANIFLGPNSNPRATGSMLDLMLCNDCRDEHNANPIVLEVRIGDFGLVTIADGLAEPIPMSAAIGTETYQPPPPRFVGPGLDMYALGIVAFELLWNFNTHMERLDCIQQLKEGNFPQGFAERFGSKRSGAVMNCITAMLAQSGNGVTISELKHMLAAI